MLDMLCVFFFSGIFHAIICEGASTDIISYDSKRFLCSPGSEMISFQGSIKDNYK